MGMRLATPKPKNTLALNTPFIYLAKEASLILEDISMYAKIGTLEK